MSPWLTGARRASWNQASANSQPASTSVGQCTPRYTRLAPTPAAASSAATRPGPPPDRLWPARTPAVSAASAVCLDGRLNPSGSVSQPAYHPGGRYPSWVAQCGQQGHDLPVQAAERAVRQDGGKMGTRHWRHHKPDGTRSFLMAPGEPLPDSHGPDVYRRIFAAVLDHVS